jgi:hypothetical protein
MVEQRNIGYNDNRRIMTIERNYYQRDHDNRKEYKKHDRAW